MIADKYKAIAELSVSLVPAIERTGLKILALNERYAKFKMPIKNNTNHIGVMYAGSLFTLGEFTGGILPAVSFDINVYYPIVKEITIRYLAMAKTDIQIEAEFSAQEVERIRKAADINSKADFSLQLDLKNDVDQVVAVVEGIWQLRKIPQEMMGMFKGS